MSENPESPADSHGALDQTNSSNLNGYEYSFHFSSAKMTKLTHH
jgi:hypothetical protein